MKSTKILNKSSTLIFLLILLGFTILVTFASEAFGSGIISTSFLKVLGKTLCLAIVAIAMDLVWGYTGILSLGHFAFFGLGGYMIGMWLMYERTRDIVQTSLSEATIPPTPDEVSDAIGNQIFGVVGSSEFPIIDLFKQSFSTVSFGCISPVSSSIYFCGWLFVQGLQRLSLNLTQAMTLALALYLFQNDSGLRGNNGLSGLQNIPGLDEINQSFISIYFFWASAFALAFFYLAADWLVSGKFGSVLKGIRDDESRIRFLGYPVENYKLFVFTLSAGIAGIGGALYYPQAGIINPAELAPIVLYNCGLGSHRWKRKAIRCCHWCNFCKLNIELVYQRTNTRFIHRQLRHSLGGLVVGYSRHNFCICDYFCS